MRRFLLLLPLLLAFGCRPSGETENQSLVLYSGRSESLVEPILERFRAATGIQVEVRYGDTAQLAVALAEEGAQSRADVFWAQDAGALGAVSGDGLFASLPDSILQKVDAGFRSPNGVWVATSARARVLAYSTERVDTTALPQSVFDLANAPYAGRVGWAPTNASFQAFVTAMRRTEGDEATLNWLNAMKASGAKSYSNNNAILQGIADGEVDFGLPNHYYLLRRKSENPNYPVAQTLFAAGDVGNLLNVAGAGVLQSSQNQEAALRLISFLLSEEAQRYFAEQTFEYPVAGGIAPAGADLPFERVRSSRPDMALEELEDLDATLAMLRTAELL